MVVPSTTSRLAENGEQVRQRGAMGLEQGGSARVAVIEALTERSVRDRIARWYRLALALTAVLSLALALPDGADGKHKRPNRRNSVATFAVDFTVPAGGAFTCVWSEAPFHDYNCNPGDFWLLEPLKAPPERPTNHALTPRDNYPHDPNVDGWGGPFPLASPDIAPRFSCRWARTEPPTDDPFNWQCSFTYNAHTHVFLVSDIVSVAYDGSNGTQQWFVPCDGVGPCPEVDNPPDTKITSGPPGAVASTDAELQFTSSEPGSTFQCRLGSAAFAACLSPLLLSGLAEGRQTFEARAVDDQGKIDSTPARREWLVDTTGPKVKISGARVRLTRTGVAKVRLRCRRSESAGPCSGRLKLATRGGLRLGSKRFKLVPGVSKRVRVKLGRSKRALVADRGRLKARAKARAHDRLGNVASSRRTFTLRAP
jgi:hypothetical protein